MEPGAENKENRTRSRGKYNVELHCLLCGSTVQSRHLSPPTPGGRKAVGGGVVKIGSLQTKSSILVMADGRKDEWVTLEGSVTPSFRVHRSTFADGLHGLP